MQPHDLSCSSTVLNPNPPDPPMVSDALPAPIHGEATDNNHRDTSTTTVDGSAPGGARATVVPARKERPARACTTRSAAAARLYAAAAAQVVERKPRVARKERVEEVRESSPVEDSATLGTVQCSKIVTPLVNEPPPSQAVRWSLRSMWELGSVLNFLNVFRPLLNINVEFSAEEFETALITPNNTLDDIHIPLLKAIPPVTRMALGRGTWVTVLCRKLRDWWHWVADGELPIVASHGAEIELYKALDPAVRVVILKALCDIRVEQEDIRNYIDNSIKHGVQLSAFRKERVGGDSSGISYWYEDDPIIGHRLYREIRKVEVKKVKGRNVPPIPNASFQWETVATNLDEFQDVSEKLFSSKNRTEASLGKKLKNDMLPEIDKVHKRKEKLLKKQHRQALLLDNFVTVDGLGPGRSLRDRKPVTYTFDDYDRSINEAIKITKRRPPSPEPIVREPIIREPTVRREAVKAEPSTNGRGSGPSRILEHESFGPPSPNSLDYEDMDEESKQESLDRSDRRRQRPQRYSEKEFVEAVSDNEADFDSDDDIVGEAVYDEEYLRKRKQMRKFSSSSEGDEEYKWDEEIAEDEEEEEEEDEDDSPSMSDDSDERPRKRFKKLPGRTRRGAKLRSVDEIQSGLRRSKRATKNRINYRNLEVSDSDSESMKTEKSDESDRHSDASDKMEFSSESHSSAANNGDEIKHEEEPIGDYTEMVVQTEQNPEPEKSSSPAQNEVGVKKRRFLDLNELAPGSGFDDGPNTASKDEDTDDF